MTFFLRQLYIFANRFTRVSLFVAVLSLALVACGDLAGQPEIVAELPTDAPMGADNQQGEGVPDIPDPLPLELPPAMPDVANGAAIFAQNCTSCHGENGAGGGILVESGQIPRMPSFLEASHMRQQSLTDYYDIITNGNLINLMPPWQSLTVQERWDVLMYAYTLHYTEEQIAQGETLVSDSVDTTLALESDAELATALSLQGEDAFASVAYQRVQSVQNWSEAIVIADSAPEATPEPQPTMAIDSASFSGTIINGSPNATVPSGLSVQLQYGDFINTAETLDGTLTEDNQFSFADIPVQAGNTYFAVAFYDGRAFVSDAIPAEELTADNTVDVTIYETTTAPNVVTMTNMEIIIEYLEVPELGRGIVARQLNVYENTTDYVFHLAPQGQDVRVSLLASLPIGSLFLDDFEQSPFIPAQEQYALIDTRPVYPGTHTISTSYFLPYDNNAQTVDIVMNNAFSGTVDILMIVPELNIVDETLTYVEERNIGTEQAPVMARRFSGDVNLLAGDNLIFDIEGRVTSGQASASEGVVTQGDLIPILIVVGVMVVLVMLSVLFYVRRDTPTNESDDA
ncbi:MAG: cytochrome c [Chloroflexota bacterium]